MRALAPLCRTDTQKPRPPNPSLEKKQRITLCLHKSNQKAVFLAPPRPKKPNLKNYFEPNNLTTNQSSSKNTSGSEYTSLKGTPLAPKDSVFAQETQQYYKKEGEHENR